MKLATRPDGSKPVRIAAGLYWRIQHAGAARGFDSVQAFLHVLAEDWLLEHPTPKPPRQVAPGSRIDPGPVSD